MVELHSPGDGKTSCYIVFESGGRPRLYVVVMLISTNVLRADGRNAWSKEKSWLLLRSRDRYLSTSYQIRLETGSQAR